MQKYVRVMDGIKSNAGGFEYKLDEINYSDNWNPNEIEPDKMGGFNFGSEDKILRWLHRGDTIYDVIVPEDAEIVLCNEEKGVWRANKIIVTNPRILTDEVVMELYKKTTLSNKVLAQCLQTLLWRNRLEISKYIVKDRVNKENVDEFIKEFEKYNKKTEEFNYDELGQDSKVVYNMLIEIRGAKTGPLLYIAMESDNKEYNTKLPTYQFGIDNDKLVELVLKGIKTATTSLNNTKIPQVGERSILTFENEKKACIIETKKVIITKFKNITPEMAFLEGEGNRTLEYYKKSHIAYFKSIEPNFNDDTEVIFEIFEVIEDLRNTRLKEAEKIVNNNEQIFGSTSHSITEINSGFNNNLFEVDNNYIIKVCGNNKENKFEKENQFYIQNYNSTHIPRLYKYDNTKTITNSVYEIISKINGKTLYYYWYKMTETEREETIKQIVNIIKEIHNTKCEPYNWANYIKSKITDAYKQTQQYFFIEEQELLEKSFNEYDKYLIDKTFAFIHNDLHFDNIIKNDNGLYLIDFNDAMVAPIDYEFRLLYMCKEIPWKWANSEMDPFQKPEDYTNIDSYIKKYYDEFSNIKYLDERMIIYRILNDICLLSRFDNDELKQSVITYTKKLLKLKLV